MKQIKGYVVKKIYEDLLADKGHAVSVFSPAFMRFHAQTTQMDRDTFIPVTLSPIGQEGPDYEAMWKDAVFYALDVPQLTSGIVIAHHIMLREKMKEIEAEHTPPAKPQETPEGE